MRRLGAPASAVRSMFLTLQSSFHHIRTAYGVSELRFGGPDREVPLQGCGQGNGASPTLWAAVSAPIFQMLKTAGLGVTIRSAITSKVTSFIGFAFVDDTDLTTSASSIDAPGESLLETTQDMFKGGVKMMQMW